MLISNTKKKLSFKKGMERLKIKDVKNFYLDISKILGTPRKRTINERLKRGGVFSPIEYDAIIELFKKYEVTDSYEELKKYGKIKQKRVRNS